MKYVLNIFLCLTLLHSLGVNAQIEIQHLVNNKPLKVKHQFDEFNLKLLMKTVGFERNRLLDKEVELATQDLVNKLKDIKYLPIQKELEELSIQVKRIEYEYYNLGLEYGLYLGDSLAFSTVTKRLNREDYKLSLFKGASMTHKKQNKPSFSSFNLQNITPQLKRKSLHLKKIYLDRALTEIHLELIEYLNDQFRLTDDQREATKERFEQLQPVVTQMFYVNYLKLQMTKQHAYEPSFYTYNTFRSVEDFGILLSSMVPMMMDAIYTYVFEDWAIATEHGIKFNGSTTANLQSIIDSLQKDLLQSTFAIDFDDNLEKLLSKIKAAFRPSIIETRLHTEDVGSFLRISNNLSAGIDETIITILALGINVDLIKLKLNHLRREFIVEVSTKPKILDIVLQDYSVTKVDQHAIGKCGFLSNKKRKGGLKISEYQDVFDNEKDIPTSLGIANEPLSTQKIIKSITPTLKKVFETPLSLFGNCYSVHLKIDGYSTAIIQQSCQ